MSKYDPKKIESKWQKFWQQKKVYIAKDKTKNNKKYVLIEFPYPSGEGLHMGHLRPYVAGDVYSRFQRMKGFETMFPIGWDAFGLPAENFAIKKGVHPSISTKQNIKNAKRQVQSWGMSFDWSREINTTDPEYYKWTQWIFLQFFKAGLAYEATGLINWCPQDKTGLANEEVIDGKCERCGTPVEKKELRQWYLQITAYAEKLLEGLKKLPEWPSQVKLQQENWIGKSEGAEIEFLLSVIPAQAGIQDSDSGSRVKPGMTNPNFLILHGRNGSPSSHLFPWLKFELEKLRHRVQMPSLPNSSEPNDEEQAQFVINNCNINENTVIVGHSFGGVVALRLLERGMKAKGVVLLCTPFSGKFLDEKVRASVTTACKKGFDFEKIKRNAQRFTLLYDSRDYVVPMSDGEAFARKLGVNLNRVNGSEPHMSGKEEPAVLETLLRATSLPTSPQAWGEGQAIKVFTTRPDTIFGATYVVLAPEHPLLQNFKSQITNIKEIEKYVEEAKRKTDIQRSALEKEKTGVELKGVKAINPATREKIPIWVADYVLMGYGTGAIMAVPAHDERDFEFAIKYGLLIRPVIAPRNIWKAIVVTVTLEGSDEFKKQLQNKGINFTLAASPTNGREHIRVELKKDQINEFVNLVQKHIKDNAWVEIIGNENILVMKNKVHKNFLERAEEWFKKFTEWEPLIRSKKSVWDMLAHNPHYKGLICYSGDGALINSSKFNGMDSEKAKWEIIELVNGIKKIQYKLRDWVFSRQRYWGEPIPIIHCPSCGTVPVPEKDLPVKLPNVKKYEPTGTGESPLAAIDKWVSVKCPNCGGQAKRETNTMPQWAGSSWYYLRYTDPDNKIKLADGKLLKHWLPVDIYFGGMEHTTLHLLYSRFWNLFLYDQGIVPVAEPYTKRVPHGIILAEDGEKMSKSRGNVVNPDEIVKLYGADTLRMYELFLGPHDQTVSWNSRGIIGVRRFLEKVYRISNFKFQISKEIPNSKLQTILHKTIKKVTEDIENYRFNTAVSALMILANELDNSPAGNVEAEILLKLLAPFAPHVAEELWSELGHKTSVHLEPWPEYDPAFMKDEFVKIAVQVNGRVRGTVQLDINATEADARKTSEGDPVIAKHLAGKKIGKFIYVPGRIINFVINAD